MVDLLVRSSHVVVHGTPEMVGDADSISGISLALLWGLHLSARGLCLHWHCGR